MIVLFLKKIIFYPFLFNNSDFVLRLIKKCLHHQTMVRLFDSTEICVTIWYNFFCQLSSFYFIYFIILLLEEWRRNKLNIKTLPKHFSSSLLAITNKVSVFSLLMCKKFIFTYFLPYPPRLSYRLSKGFIPVAKLFLENVTTLI